MQEPTVLEGGNLLGTKTYIKVVEFEGFSVHRQGIDRFVWLEDVPWSGGWVLKALRGAP